VVVVGPSGAGKDTLIAIARDHCRDHANIVFPRRVVTRARTAAEDHDSVSDDIFDARARSGAFAVWWEAHGLKYAFRS
jgi:ribose 1,5-bisphosphokinase